MNFVKKIMKIILLAATENIILIKPATTGKPHKNVAGGAGQRFNRIMEFTNFLTDRKGKHMGRLKHLILIITHATRACCHAEPS